MSTLHAPKGLRVCIITGIFPPDIGGPATYVPHIAAALAERGHRITVLTLSDCLEHDDSQYGFRVMRLPRRLFKPWRWVGTWRGVLAFGADGGCLVCAGLGLEGRAVHFWLGAAHGSRVGAVCDR